MSVAIRIQSALRRSGTAQRRGVRRYIGQALTVDLDVATVQQGVPLRMNGVNLAITPCQGATDLENGVPDALAVASRATAPRRDQCG